MKRILFLMSLLLVFRNTEATTPVIVDTSYSIPQGQLDPEILDQFMPFIEEEVEKTFTFQNDGRTRRNTREYGYSFFRMEKNDFTYTPPPSFFQELGTQLCKALGHEPVGFTNIILSLYEEGFHLEPHVDINSENLYPGCFFYFDENVYGIVIESDPTGHLYFVKWEGEGLVPPLDLEPVFSIDEHPGSIFCLQGSLRKAPYFHAVTPVSKRRLSITFRTVVKIER